MIGASGEKDLHRQGFWCVTMLYVDSFLFLSLVRACLRDRLAAESR